MSKPLICVCCGAKINRATMRCEYCGTEYREEHGVPVIRYESFQNPVQTFGATVYVGDMDLERSPKDAMEYALHRLAEEMLPAVVAGMEVRCENTPFGNEVRGRVRIVIPKDRGLSWRT